MKWLKDTERSQESWTELDASSYIMSYTKLILEHPSEAGRKTVSSVKSIHAGLNDLYVKRGHRPYSKLLDDSLYRLSYENLVKSISCIPDDLDQDLTTSSAASTYTSSQWQRWLDSLVVKCFSNPRLEFWRSIMTVMHCAICRFNDVGLIRLLVL